MKRAAILLILLLALVGCGDPDPYTALERASGQITATAQAQNDATIATAQAQNAGNWAVQATQQAQVVQATADAWQATAAADSAISAAMRASARATEQTAVLQMAQARDLATATAVIATQSAQATATAIGLAAQTDANAASRDWAFWAVIETAAAGFFLALLTILGVLLLGMSKQATRMMEAKASSYAVRALPDGRILDLTDPMTPSILGDATRPQSGPGLPPLFPAETAQQVGDLTGNHEFLTFLDRCAESIPEKWNARQLPSANKMYAEHKVSGSTWHRYIKWCEQQGWVSTTTSGTYITKERTLLDLYRWANARPAAIVAV